MYEGLQEIIDTSTFTIEDGEYIYVQTKSAPNIEKHFMVTRDDDEYTVVTLKENIDDLEMIEKNKDLYSLIEINLSIPFYSVGFLATICEALADENMNVLVVSTCSKDYFMVKSDRTQDARIVLKKLGFSEANL